MADADRRERGRGVVSKLFPSGTVGEPVPLPKRFRQFTVDHLFGDLWTGEDLEIEERSLITCTTLIALNREDEMRIHFQGAKNLGLPRAKIEELITHVGHYAGWPAAVSAFRALGEVWPPDDK